MSKELHFSGKMLAGFMAATSLLTCVFFLFKSGGSLHSIGEGIGTILAGAFLGIPVFVVTVMPYAWYKSYRRDGYTVGGTFLRMALSLLVWIGIGLFWKGMTYLIPYLGLLFLVMLPFYIRDSIRVRKLKTIKDPRDSKSVAIRE